MNELEKIRNDLYNSLPTGEINSFDLIKVIEKHLERLDKFIDSTTPPSGKSESDILISNLMECYGETTYEETAWEEFKQEQEYPFLIKAMHEFAQQKEPKALMEWISVKDRLPDESSDVLIIRKEGDFFYVPQQAEFKNGVFCMPENMALLIGEFNVDKITHWMPLPNKPV